ncbi:MAG: acetate--CoA ligase family protein [Candidatus Hydrothermarchaeota archaeon]
MLESIFRAKSIAVVGASEDPSKLGNTLLRNIIDGGFEGKIYPINPKAERILGLKAYKNVLEIEEDIDLAVIVVPNKIVPSVMEDIGRKGIKGAIVISGGFREIGEDELEKNVVEVAKKHGVRVLGPNCQGINYTYNKMCASWPLIKSEGPLAIISQSGTIGASFAMWAEEEGIGISSFVSLGNKCDIDETDLIEFFAQDDNTKAISLYIEGIEDGKKFMEVARRTTKKKPVIILKPGKTEKGRKAIETHTKSIVGEDEVYDAAFRQVGVKRVEDLTQLYDFSKAFALLKKPRGKNLAIVTSSGGSAILATDLAERLGLNVVEISKEARDKLREILPPHCIVSNPIDLTGDANANMYEETLEILINEENIDAFLVIFGDPIENACEVIKRIREKTDKEIVVCYLGGGEVEKEESLKMHKEGIPVFPTPERAVRVINALVS